MHQSGAATLAPEEPDELITHVRGCGGAGWVTIGSTRKPSALGTPPKQGKSPATDGVVEIF